MAKKAKATDAPRGAKTAAIKQALNDNPQKTAKEIAEIVKGQGFETTANYVGTLKNKMSGKKRKKRRAAAPAPEAVATPAVPKDAVSVALLQKAKKLAAQLGGIKQAKSAMDALAQIMD
jgi:hypothetical protein